MTRPARQRRFSILLLLLLAVGIGACRDIASQAGPSTDVAAIYSDQVVYALLARFGPTVPDDNYDEVRARIARSALVPSRLLRDSSVWTAATSGRHELRYVGRMADRGYLLGTRGTSGRITRPGDYRRRVLLDEVGEDQFRWFVRDELGIGAVDPAQLGAVASAMLDAAEGVSGSRIRTTSAAALPRTTEQVGRLFQMDSVRTSSLPGGGSRLRFVFTMTPEGIRGEYPRYGAYLDRYVTPLRLDATILDPAGSDWVTATIADRAFTITLAVRDGRLVPLDGSRRPPPSRMRLESAIRTRIGLFGIGASDLNANMTVAGADEPGLTFRFQDEPDWDFPPLVEGFLRSSLRRPFEGQGIGYVLRLGQVDDQTIVTRDYTITVQESTIVRWIGELAATLTSDFRSGADLEFDHYNGEILRALRADLAALLR